MSTPRTSSSPAATKPPTAIEIPSVLRARIETALRAVIPDATDVRISITRRKTGYGARTTPWVLVIAADHPYQSEPRVGSFGPSSTVIANGNQPFGGHSYATPAKAIEAAELETARWLENRTDEAHRCSGEHTKRAAEYARMAAMELAKSARLSAVLAAFREDPVLTADGADGQSPQTTTEPR